MLTLEDQILCLNNVANHLSDNGKFIFDVFIPDPGILANGFTKYMDFEDEYEMGMKFRRYVSTESDMVNQITSISWELEWESEKGLERKTWDMPFRFFFRYELEHLISLSALRLDNCYGDFNQSSLNKDSRELVMICSRSD